MSEYLPCRAIYEIVDEMPTKYVLKLVIKSNQSSFTESLINRRRKCLSHQYSISKPAVLESTDPTFATAAKGSSVVIQ